MKEVIKNSEGDFYIGLNTILITDKNGKINLKQTAENLEEQIRYDSGEVVEIKIKRVFPFKEVA